MLFWALVFLFCVMLSAPVAWIDYRIWELERKEDDEQ